MHILAALQQLMIIPRSPTPVPLEARAIEDLTADEARELLRRQRVWLSLWPLLADQADSLLGKSRRCRNSKDRKQSEVEEGPKRDHNRYQTCEDS